MCSWVLQGLNLVVNQPGGGSADQMGGAGRSAAAEGAARRLHRGAGVVGGRGPHMVNEGRWTDNGQPLTAAEGRTVTPMLEQVEQAIVARLLRSQAFEDPSATGAEGAGEEKEEGKAEQVSDEVLFSRGSSYVWSMSSVRRARWSVQLVRERYVFCVCWRVHCTIP